MAVLEQELKFFAENKPKWIEDHSGKFVLVKGEQLIDVFDNADTAVSEGVRRFGMESFLVRQVTPADEEIQIPALTLGLLHAVTA